MPIGVRETTEADQNLTGPVFNLIGSIKRAGFCSTFLSEFRPCFFSWEPLNTSTFITHMYYVYANLVDLSGRVWELNFLRRKKGEKHAFWRDVSNALDGRFLSLQVAHSSLLSYRSQRSIQVDENGLKKRSSRKGLDALCGSPKKQQFAVELCRAMLGRLGQELNRHYGRKIRAIEQQLLSLRLVMCVVSLFFFVFRATHGFLFFANKNVYTLFFHFSLFSV